MSQYTLEIERQLIKRVSLEKIKEQVRFIAGRATNGPRGNGWEYKIGKIITIPNDSNTIYRTKVTFKPTKNNRRRIPKEQQILPIYDYFDKAMKNAKFSHHPWTYVNDEVPGEQPKPSTSPKVKTLTKDYGEINLEKENHFEGIYERVPQTNIIMSALQLAKQTDLSQRHHCVLYGPPGSGKTALCLRVANMLGIEENNYMKFDATSTTEAGATQKLLEAPYIPPVCIVEEIEKADEKMLRFWLGVLDERGEVRKLNYRIGHRCRNVPMLVLATVNNIKLFNRLLEKALSSRFQHKIYCPRPSKDALRSILLRDLHSKDFAEIEEERKTKWIDATLEFCCDIMGWTDPRIVQPICLCGQDKLLTGEYQRDKLLTMPQRKIEKIKKIKSPEIVNRIEEFLKNG